MKLRLTLWITLFLMFMANSKAKDYEKNESIQFTKRLHNFGAVNARNGDLSYDFVFVNNSGKAVNIRDVDASCGCTVARWTKERIKPGDRGTVSVLLRINKLSGYFSKVVNVFIDDKEEPIVLQVTGRVLRNYAYDDPFKFKAGHLLSSLDTIKFDSNDKRATQTRDVKFINTTRDTVVLEVQEGTTDYIMTQTHKTIAPGANSMIVFTSVTALKDLRKTNNIMVKSISKKDTIDFTVPIIIIK